LTSPTNKPPSIRTLKEIRAMIKPYPVRQPLQATRHYEPVIKGPRTGDLDQAADGDGAR
jgi:hypothetical protein